MKTIFITALCALCLVVFAGCPYGSEVSIDKASVKVDEKLLGKWEPKSSSDDQITVTKADQFTYKIEKRTKNSADVTVYKGFLSTVDGTKFINIFEESASTPTYYLYKLDISSSGAKATLAPITDNIDEKFETSEALKAFIQKYKDLSFFYVKEEDVFIRAD
jgi:hypothetical protein